ncbi:hypothetical protein [Micromonospora sp. CNB394]|uniref:hypothetical protein n=1 Tax=Micromonospora sp. CNB394 TaxID=1169151 RepID=UPI00036E0CD5|nr:hypothetical protein [Micromonospora sp. CNB394]
MTSAARPHLPIRPMWLCKRCAHPWPCAVARLSLVAEYAGDRVGMSVYLCGQLYEAAIDLHRLNPNEAPSPQALFVRFVGWASLRSPP